MREVVFVTRVTSERDRMRGLHRGRAGEVVRKIEIETIHGERVRKSKRE